MSSAPLMKAIGITGGAGPAGALHEVKIPRPVPSEGQILIRILAAGVNRPDIIQREGKYPPPPGAPETLGLEVAGEVVHAAGRWKQGDKVCALLGGGGYAEYAVCDARHALPIPTGLDVMQAAALPETVFTVFANVFEAGGLKKGETLLIHGATSGIGTTAIQMAKALGARVIATSRGKDKAEQAKKIGADLSVDVTTSYTLTCLSDFADVAKKEGGVDVVLDMVGAPYFSQNLDALKIGGRIVYIATQAGDKTEFSISALMRKRAVITGSTLRPRNSDEKARLAAAVEKEIWPLVERGLVKPLVHKTFPLGQAAAAHSLLESGSHLGKIMLSNDE